MKNNLRQIELIIYKLKRLYGLPASLRRPLTNVSDILTGKITKTYETHKIRHCVRLPSDKLKDYVYTLTYLAANKNFAYGATFERTLKYFLIDSKDLPRDFEITETDELIVEGKQYTLALIEKAEDRSAWMIKAKALETTDIISDP